jgi:hypothetical protein
MVADAVFEFAGPGPIWRAGSPTVYASAAGVLLEWSPRAAGATQADDGHFAGWLADAAGAWFEGVERRVSACLIELDTPASSGIVESLNLLQAAPWACAQRTYLDARVASRRALVILHWTPPHLGGVEPHPRAPQAAFPAAGGRVARCLHGLVLAESNKDSRVLPILARSRLPTPHTRLHKG